MAEAPVLDPVGAAVAGEGPIGVVVVNYGSAGLLAVNLRAAGELGPDVRVVVVDNFSSAAERDAVADLGRARGWDVVLLPGNRGFGVASNAGAARARELGCAAVLCLNPDARITPEVVAELRAACLRRPWSMVAPLVVDSAGTEVFRGSAVSLDDGRIRGDRPGRAPLPHSEPWLTGACVALSMPLWEALGGFAYDYFLYWEDVDLSHRALAAGAELELRRDLRVVHDEGGTHREREQLGKSPLYYRWNCRNRLVFAARNLPRRQVLRWLARTPAVSWEILLRGGRRQLVHSPRPAWAALRGSVEGALLALALIARPRRRPAPAGRRRVLVAHPGAELYGSDRVLLETVAGLTGTDDVVVALPGDGPLADAVRALGAEVVRCPMPVLRKSALRPVGLARLLATAVAGVGPAVRLLRTAGRDGVYVSTLTLPSWVLLARLLRRPVVVHVHEAERDAAPLVRRVLAAPVALATAVAVNSRFSLDVLAASAPGVRGRSTVVLNGVPGPAEVTPARAELTGDVRLLYMGRLSPRKGPQVAVDALAELRRRGIPATLTLLGSVFPGYEWFERELHARVAAAGLTDRVAFAGFRDDVWPALADADVVLVPSVVDEPFGNTAVEAVLAGRPLVVSDSSGLREAAEGYAAARAVPPGDVPAWADAVQELVAGWPAVRRAALADADRARDRHAPAAYRTRIAELLHRSWDAR